MALLRKPEPIEIALAFPVGIPHLDRVARGIREFAARPDAMHWQFTISPETHHLPPAALKGWRGDGVIALCNTASDLETMREIGCPVVEISGARESATFPRVRPDYEMIGRLAAQHLLRCGFRRFAFYGVEEVWYSSRYEAGFTDELAARGLDLARLEAPNTLEGITRWDSGQADLERWLDALQPPFAVMAAHDPRAAMVIRACDRLGLRVPQDVAVIGVNDDTGTCEASRPTLTSIERNGQSIGQAAAALLDRLISEPDFHPPAETVLPPGEILVRDSTDGFSLEDPVLARAVELIQGRYASPITIADVVEASGKSRRWLEDAFRKYLDRTPGEFLAQTRLTAAKETLTTQPEASLSEVASASGFADTRQLNATFQRLEGISARHWRAGEPDARISHPRSTK